MSAKAQDFHDRLFVFMTEFVFPAEASYEAYRREAGPDDHTVPPVVEDLKKLAKDRGLWNLFLPAESGLTNLEYAPLAELSGWSMEIAPEATNCAAPDTGNMETLHLFATEEQREQWLEPLLAGEIRSAFAMTEPAVASSDARNIETTMLRDGGDYIINGRKWWITGAADPRCKILIVMGRTNPDAASHQQQSMILVPVDTPGVSVERSLPVFGWQDQHGHCEITFNNVAGACRESARRGGRRLCDRTSPLWPGPHPSLHASHRRRRAGDGPDDRPGPKAHRVWQAAGRTGRGAANRLRSPATRSTRPGCCATRLPGPSTSTATRARKPGAGGHDQGGGTADGVQRHRPRDPGARRDGYQRRHPVSRLYGWHRAMRLFDGPDEVHMRTIARAELGKEKSAFASAVTSLVAVRARPSSRGHGTFVTSPRRRGIRPGRLFRSGELSTSTTRVAKR